MTSHAAVRPGFELPPNGRRVLVVAHVLLAGLTMGGLTALLAALTLRHAAMPAAGDRIAFLLLDYLVVPASIGFVITGAGFSLFTRWGFARYLWIIAKWIGAVALGAALIVGLSPTVAVVASLSDTGPMPGDAPLYAVTLAAARTWAAGCLLLTASLIAVSVFKPGRARADVKGMMSRRIQAGVSLLALALIAAFAWQALTLQQLRHAQVQSVPLSGVPDGSHQGSATVAGFDFGVSVRVEGGQLLGVEILRNRDSGYARRAERVTRKIVAAQSPCVDGVTGATTTSRALQAAVGDALVRAAAGTTGVVDCP